MELKRKITISISPELLKHIDSKIDKINFKSRSHVIENFVRDGLSLKKDL
jgi:metal-responsive CopG/Arc/MetJ family transcriptional regulator